MADPLRRTLSKLRGKRSKKGPAGGLGAECNGEGKEQRGGSCKGTAEESIDGCKADIPREGKAWTPEGCKGETSCENRAVTPGERKLPAETVTGWCSHNHNNNNYSCSMKYEVQVGSKSTGVHMLGSRQSYNDDKQMRHNGVQRGCTSMPQPFLESVSRIDDKQGPLNYGGYQNHLVNPLNPPVSVPYVRTHEFEEQWAPPYSAPFSNCSMTFMYPQPSDTRIVHETKTGLGSSASAHCYTDMLGNSRSFNTSFHTPSLDYPKPVGGPFYGSNRNHSEDSEEDDYYDNDNLLITETIEPQFNSLCLGQDVVSSQIHRTVTSQAADYGYQQRKDSVDIYLETDRLRSQLQEAYYLLIHAMHDMPLENHTDKVVSKLERCPSSSQSQDSVYSQSSVRAIESDVWSSDEASPKQLSHSDLVSLNALKSSEINRLQACSKSLDTVYTVPLHETLQKFHSDSLIKYSVLNSCSSSDCGFEQGTVSPRADVCVESEGDASPQAVLCTVNWGMSEGSHDNPLDYLHEVPGDNSSMSTSSTYVTSVNSGGQGFSQKPSGLTVKKMQKWMYKGRLLSLEMKERIIGSSQRTSGSCRLVSSNSNNNRPELPQSSSAALLKVSGENQGPPMTDLIENVYASSIIRRDLKITEANEHNLQKNRITVSKKRNWLTQSTHRYQHREENNVSRRYPGNNQTDNSHNFAVKESQPSVSNSRNESHCKVRGMTKDTVPVTPTSSSALPVTVSDLNEENDADDEGEIWYNPIPEDDDPYLCTSKSSSQMATVPGSDLLKAPESPGRLKCSATCVGDTLQMSTASELNRADSLHSTDYCMQKQKFVNKNPMGLPAEEAPTHKSNESGTGVQSPIKANLVTATEFSPPSSPNPLKKGGSINWSLPDKIKSPRTVRKLSMRMKKLPELSRKLSVKGSSNHTSTEQPVSLCKGNCQAINRTQSVSSSGNSAAAASRNVISRYHLDSSVSSQQSYKKKSSGSSKSSSKGGYLSDGDSPELIAKSGKHGSENRSTKGKEALPGSNTKTEIDIDAFRHYSFSDQPKCFQYISGLMSLHFYGAEDLKPPKIDSKDVFCAIQVDSVNKARTALLTCRTTFLDMDHTFNIELENAQHLKLVVFSWDPTPRKNRVCCHGTVVLPTLFRVTKTHQLAVKLEPRGLIYVKLNLMEQWENSLDRLGVDREPVIFGVEARKVVEKENAGLMVPLLMEKCIVEIEKRGCQVVGLYRLCGSAAVKKELREAFERDSKAVGLCENQYPDINVITGVLKDYLRELPSPLITKQLYEAVLNAMAEKPLKITANCCENDYRDSEHTVALLNCLPDVERATLKMLLDHLKLVASYHEVNKMTCQNLAVCFGPVLLSQRQETSNHNNRVFIDSEELASALDFKKHIEVLHYLLQLWPVKNVSAKEPTLNCKLTEQQPCLRRKKPRPQLLNLNSSEMSGVLRPRVARLDSPSSNRYAGDWSSCRESYFITPKETADYDDVPSEDTENRLGVVQTDEDDVSRHLLAKEHSLEAFVTVEGNMLEKQDVNLQDLQESIDTLLGNLERELNKNKLNVRL